MKSLGFCQIWALFENSGFLRVLILLVQKNDVSVEYSARKV